MYSFATSRQKDLWKLQIICRGAKSWPAAPQFLSRQQAVGLKMPLFIYASDCYTDTKYSMYQQIKKRQSRKNLLWIFYILLIPQLEVKIWLKVLISSPDVWNRPYFGTL